MSAAPTPPPPLPSADLPQGGFGSSGLQPTRVTACRWRFIRRLQSTHGIIANMNTSIKIMRMVIWAFFICGLIYAVPMVASIINYGFQPFLLPVVFALIVLPALALYSTSQKHGARFLNERKRFIILIAYFVSLFVCLISMYLFIAIAFSQ